MARVYVSKKINENIAVYQNLVPNYDVIEDKSIIAPAYVIISVSEVQKWKDIEDVTIITILDDCANLRWINTYGHNYMENDPCAIALLIEVLCTSSYHPIRHQHVTLTYKNDESSQHYSYETINQKNFWTDFLMRHMGRILIVTSCLSLLLVLSTVCLFKAFDLWSSAMWLKMAGLVCGFEGVLALLSVLINYSHTYFLQRKMKNNHCLIQSNAYKFYSLNSHVVSLEFEE